MRNPASTFRNLTIATCIALTPIAIAPTATAEPITNTFQIPLVWNTGIWICSGIHTFCSMYPTAITGETPAVVSFPSVVTNFDGYSWIHWTNISTLQSGVAMVRRGETVDVHTGTGLVTATITNGYEALAGTGVFWVP